MLEIGFPVAPHWIADRERAPFTHFLQKFDLSALDPQKREAAFKAVVFAYVRADCPALQIDWGTKQIKAYSAPAVGDLFAFDERGLFVIVQVRARTFLSAELPDAAGFARVVAEHSTTGLVVAFDFEGDSRGFVNALRLNALSLADLVERTRLWDALKQQCAVRALFFYLGANKGNDVIKVRVNALFK